MHVRELTKGKRNWKLKLGYHAHNVVSSFQADGVELEKQVVTKEEFQSEFKSHLADGWTETEASLARRAFIDGTEKEGKFWIIQADGEILKTRYGKIRKYGMDPNDGQEKIKYFDSAADALAEYHKQIAKKLSDGYHEFMPRQTPYSEPPPELKQAKTPIKKKTPKKTPAAKKTTPTEASAASGKRRFEFTEGSSSKFWEIEQSGNSHTVCYGRIGTEGQTKTREFADESKAKSAAEKLIEQKTAKGYTEITSATETAVEKEQPSSQKPKSKKKAVAEVKPPEPPPVVTEVTHFIDLHPHVAFYALWRDPDPLPKPEVRPYDAEACLEAIRGVRSARHDFALPLPEDPLELTPAEAEFWLTATHVKKDHRSPKSLADALAKKNFTGNLPLEQLKKRSEKNRYWHTEYLLPILGAEQFLELILAYGGHRWGSGNGLYAFQWWGLPYLSRTEREKFRKIVRPKANTAKIPSRDSDGFPVVCQLAAALGCHDVAEKLIQNYAGHSEVERLIWGLGSAEQVEQTVDRFASAGKIWWYFFSAHAWLAHTQTRRLDILVQAAKGNWKPVPEFVSVLALVKDPAAAPLMLELRTLGIAADVATAWLDEQIGNAVTGLVPLAAGKGELADAARSYLREKQRMGYGDIIEKALKQVSKEDAQKLRTNALNVPPLGPPLDDKTTPKDLKPLFEQAAEISPLKKNDWAQASKFPPVALGKHRLSEEQLEGLILALQQSDFPTPHPLVSAIREQADRETLAEFAWTLFELWIANAAPSAHKWAMRSLGFLGNDQTALRLAPLVRKWPGESQHPRAVLGLACLRAIGSDIALMQLSGIAQKVKFKALQKEAMDCVEAVAAGLGLTKGELEDRVVPDLGLDRRGRKVFDFGPRKFEFVLGGDLKPLIDDGSGKLRKDLPKPAAADDKELAKAAAEEFKNLKKQIRETAGIQVVRLEQAMITGRRWSPPNFETLLVQHPLMTNLVRNLLWAGFDKKGKRLLTFRVTLEQDYADVDDNAITLDAFDRIGIPHALNLNAKEAAAWGAVFADYEITPPFTQLGRTTHELTAAEKKQSSFKKIEGLKIPASPLMSVLKKLAWTRGMPQDNGVFREHYKHFHAANVTAVVTYEYGVGISYYGEEEDQEIDGAYFVPGIYKPTGWPNHKKFVKLGDVDPVVVSEVLADLNQIAAKAV